MFEAIVPVAALTACCAVPLLGALAAVVVGKRLPGSASQGAPQDVEELPKLQSQEAKTSATREERGGHKRLT
ncbi:MAG: hypothetical protein HY685_00895 [Chloroflexi bacterium]|nr:hypothetical protein [Chloroflexota bacterium]